MKSGRPAIPAGPCSTVFKTPADGSHFPVMLELFCRTPDGIVLVEGSHLTPIPLDEAVASLSAILLDDEYTHSSWLAARSLNGLPWVGEDRLIPLKASAWLDLSARQMKGEAVDSRRVFANTQTTCFDCRNCLHQKCGYRWRQGLVTIYAVFSTVSRQIARSIRVTTRDDVMSPKLSNALPWPTNWSGGNCHDCDNAPAPLRRHC